MQAQKTIIMLEIASEIDLYESDEVPEPFTHLFFEPYREDISHYAYVPGETYERIKEQGCEIWMEQFNGVNRDRDDETKSNNMAEGLACEIAFNLLTENHITHTGENTPESQSFDFLATGCRTEKTIELKTASMSAKAQNLPIRKYPAYNSVRDAMRTRNGFPDVYVLAYTCETQGGLAIGFDFVIPTIKLLENEEKHWVPKNQLYVYPRDWCTLEGFTIDELNEKNVIDSIPQANSSE